MKRFLLSAALITLLIPASKGQGCSVCTKTASQLGEKGAKGLNTGIIYLAFLPLCIMGTVGFVWYKYQKTT